MAGAEARAVWQRTANRCFVQEDAKRAPKLACCQSPSSSTKQVDEGPTSATDATDHFVLGFVPLNRNPPLCNLPPDTRWWLQQQPSYGYPKGLTYEQLNALETEKEILKAGIMSSPSKNCDVVPQDDSKLLDGNKKDSVIDVYSELSSDSAKNFSEVERALYYENALDFAELRDTRGNMKLTEADAVGSPKKNSENSFDLQSPWIGSEKNVPWWRTTDRDDLAYLVAQKSLDLVENCDLPPPQRSNVTRWSCSFGSNGIQASSLVQKVASDCISGPNIPLGFPNSEGLYGREKTSMEGQSESNSERSFSGSYTKTYKHTAETGQLSVGDPCKAQLLEALCHSQTRAREAEEMAKRACAEKEDIIKLFFRQASQLFAYKQWFQLLQLETLYYQLKNSNQPMSTLFPVVLPWVPQKGRKLRKNWQRNPKGKRTKKGRRRRHDFGRYAVAFALSLSLVGAGLLLGVDYGVDVSFLELQQVSYLL